MIGLKAIIAVTALALTLGVSGGCTPKEQKSEVKVVKTEKVLAVKPAVSVESLDKRVSVLERKARGYDAEVKAARARAVVQ